MQNLTNGESKMQIVISTIKNNDYVKKCTSNKKKNIHSFSYLIDRELSHSDCIKLGYGIENVLRDLILKYNTKLKNIKKKNEKGKKETDHLFCDDTNKIIYYAELKSNIYLDTEKCKSTYEKCLKIVKDLKKDYPEYDIKWCLLGCRYTDINEIHDRLKKKYSCIQNNLFGVNEYLNLLINIPQYFTPDSYREFLNKLADYMFSNS